MTIEVDSFELVEIGGYASIEPNAYSVDSSLLILTAGIFIFLFVIFIIWRN